MTDFVTTHRLTHKASLKMIEAGLAKAEALGCKVSLAVADQSCRLIAFLMMDGARHFSIITTQRKAITAASQRPDRLRSGGKCAVDVGTHGRLHQCAGRVSDRGQWRGDRRGRCRRRQDRTGCRGSEGSAGGACAAISKAHWRVTSFAAALSANSLSL